MYSNQPSGAAKFNVDTNLDHPVWVSWLDYRTLGLQTGHPLDLGCQVYI